MKELEYIILNFENCESMRIDAKDVMYMDLDNISRHISYYSGRLQEHRCAKDVVLFLSEDVTSSHPRYDGLPFMKSVGFAQDIVSIGLKKAGRKYVSTYVVDWDDDGTGQRNTYQHAGYIEKGYFASDIAGKHTCYITISADANKIEDYF